MTNTNFAEAYVGADYFSESQRKALVDWVLSMSDGRLEIVRNQLMHAVAAYDTIRDDVTVGTALLARSQTVMIETQRRGGVPLLHPVCVPWDYTKLPPPEERGIFVQKEERPLNVLLQVLSKEPRPLTINNVPVKNDTDQFIRLPDLLNDPDEAEAYRMADNDFSGLPVVSCEVIDVDKINNIFDVSLLSDVASASVNETFFTPDDISQEVDAIFQLAANSSTPSQETIEAFEAEYDVRAQDPMMDAADVGLIDPRTLDTEWVSDEKN